MENKKLLEEIKKFKKLAGIITEAVTTTPTQWVGSIISKMAAYTLDNAEVVRLTRALGNKIEISTSKLITRIDWDNLTEAELDELFKNQRIFIAFKEALDNEGSDVMLDTAIDFYPDALKKAAIAYRKKVNPLRPYSPPQQPVPGGNNVPNPSVSQIIGGQINTNQIATDVLNYLSSLKTKGEQRDKMIEAIIQLTGKQDEDKIIEKLNVILQKTSGEGYRDAEVIAQKIAKDVANELNKKEWYQFWLKNVKPLQGDKNVRPLTFKEWMYRVIYITVAAGYLTGSYREGSFTRGEGVLGILKNVTAGTAYILTGGGLENFWDSMRKDDGNKNDQQRDLTDPNKKKGADSRAGKF